MSKIAGWGERMRRAREGIGLTVEQAAVRIGVTRTTLASWERETTSPDLGRVSQIARELQIDAAYLVFGRERQRAGAIA